MNIWANINPSKYISVKLLYMTDADSDNNLTFPPVTCSSAQFASAGLGKVHLRGLNDRNSGLFLVLLSIFFLGLLLFS